MASGGEPSELRRRGLTNALRHAQAELQLGLSEQILHGDDALSAAVVTAAHEVDLDNRRCSRPCSRRGHPIGRRRH